jgi:hypothetical protein
VKCRSIRWKRRRRSTHADRKWAWENCNLIKGPRGWHADVFWADVWWLR